MFFAAHADGTYSPLNLTGIGPSEAVKGLQKSLAKLSSKLSRPGTAPGPVTGTLNERTMVAVAGMLDHIAPHLPVWVHQPLSRALKLGVSSTEAKNTVGRYVTELHYAADKAHEVAPSPFGDALAASDPSFFAPGWYTMPSRLALLGGLVLLGFWLYSRSR